MKKITLFFVAVFLLLTSNSYSQIMTSDNQGLKRSSLLHIEKIRKTFEPQKFVIGGLGLHPSQVSLYGMLGYVKKYGYYGKLKTNFNFNNDDDNTVWGNDPDKMFVKDTHKGRFSITAGGMYRINNPMSLYAGLGYGYRSLNLLSVSGEMYNYEDYSYRGLEVEAGLIHQLKNGLFLNMGFSVIVGDNTYGELNLGVGINLEGPKYKKVSK